MSETEFLRVLAIEKKLLKRQIERINNRENTAKNNKKQTRADIMEAVAHIKRQKVDSHAKGLLYQEAATRFKTTKDAMVEMWSRDQKARKVPRAEVERVELVAQVAQVPFIITEPSEVPLNPFAAAATTAARRKTRSNNAAASDAASSEARGNTRPRRNNKQ